ncbi:MAG: hemoblobin-interacting domain-containing protein [Bacteroidales bacterium]
MKKTITNYSLSHGLKLLAVLFILLLFSGVSRGQTNPTTGTLPYSFTGAATIPSTMAIHRFGTTSGSIPTTRTTSDGTGDLPVTTTNNSGGYLIEGTGGADGVSLLASGSQSAGAIVVEISTTGKTAISVSWLAWTKLDQTTYTCSMALQYRIGESGTWINVDNPLSSVYSTNATIGRSNTTSFSQTLPVLAENQPIVQLRWIYWISAGASGSRDRLAIDEISITGTSSLTTPTLNADATLNDVDHDIDITFTEDFAWRTAITAVKIGGTALNPSDYVISAGNIQLKPSNGNVLLTTSGSKSITVEATNYSTASVTQSINAGAPTSNSTATINLALAPNTTRTITCTAKDQYNNLVSGYTFKYDAVITNNDATTGESYTIDGTATITNATDINLVAVTNVSGVATFTAALPVTIDGADGINIQVQLSNGSTNIGTAFSFTQLQSQTISFTALTPATYGDIPYTISASGGASGNPVVFTSSDNTIATCTGINGSTITIIAPGSCTIHANQAGNSSYNAALQVDQTLLINTKTLTIPDAAAQNKTYTGTNTAVITGTLNGIISPDVVTLNGTATFADVNVANNIDVTSTATLGGAAAAKYTLTQPTGLKANITPATQTITFNALANKTIGDADYSPGATSPSSSVNTITYSSSNTLVAEIVSGQIHIVGVGTTSITASQAASLNYSAATDVSQSLTVNALPIIAWQFGNPAALGTEVTYNSTTNNSNLNTSILSRGNGITATALARGFSANAWDVSGTKTTAENTNEYFQFTVNAKTSYKVSLSTLDATLRRTSTGPNAYIWKYSLDGSSFTEIGTEISFTSTADGVAQTQIDLSGVTALQNVNDATTITFRLYAWGGSSLSSTFAFGRYGTGITTNSLAIGGTVAVNITAPAVTTLAATLIDANGATFNGNITSDGGTAITERGFCYKTTSGVAITDNKTAESGVTSGTYSKGFTGLDVNTEYFYKAYATNSIAATLSTNEISFYTLANFPSAPTVNNPTSSTLDVAVNVNGNPSTTEFAIQETGSLKYVQADGSLNTSAVWQTAFVWSTKTVNGLSALTSYTFQVKARNTANTETAFGATTTLSTSVGLIPTLSVGTIAAFGSQCINATYGPNSFIITGANLTTADVTVAALNGFSFSTLAVGTYTTTLTLPQTGGSFSQEVFVKFTPVTVQSYNGDIVIGGGGASDVNRSVTAAGINTSVTVTTTSPAASVTATTVTLSGDVTSEGCQIVSERGICYGTSTDPDILGSKSIETGTTGVYSSNIINLLPNTLYHFRAYATSAATTVYGSDVSFTTAGLTAPVATAASLQNASGFTANWNAVTGATSYRLDVSTTSGFISNVISENFSGFTTNAGTSDRSSSLNTYLQTTGWTGTAIYEMIGYTKIGAGSTKGIITTPTINLSANSGNATLSFDLGKYGTDAGLVQVYHAADGSNFVQVGSDITPPASLLTQTIAITGGTANSKIRIQAKNASSNRFYLDNILVQSSSALASYNDLSVSGTTQAVTGLNPNTNYYYRVRAYSTSSTSPNSNVITALTTPAAATVNITQPSCTVSKASIEITAPLGTDYEYNIDGANYQSSPVFANIATGNHEIFVRSVSVPSNISAVSNVIVNAQPLSPSAPLITATESVCQSGCSLGGGSFNTITDCGTGSTLTYFTDINATTLASTPVYDQNNAMTIYYACVDNTNGCKSTVQTLTTVPGTCTIPAVPVITATESVCQSGCTVGGGSFNTITDCGIGSTLAYFTDINGSTPTSAPVYNQTTPMTIYYACVDNTTGCKSTVQTLTTIPGICNSPSTPLITATESVCQSGCAVGGGSFNIITDCGIGSTLTYFTDISGSTTTSAPVYDQNNAMSIYYACVNNTTGCKSTVQTLTTIPGICTNPSAPLITATESVCQSGCAVGGGSFNTITDCGTGSTLTYFTDISGSTTTSAPVYDQNNAMSIYYACVNNTTGCKSTVQTLTTIPGICTNPSAPLITATESVCQSGCAVGGGSFNTITDCGIGSTLTYFTDINATTLASTPVYDQNNAMTIYYACVNNTTGCKSAVQTLTTVPGTCTNPSTPLITATESVCQSGCAVGGGSFNTITDCGIGSTLTYFTDINATTLASTPVYDQNNAMTIYYACVNNTTGCKSAVQTLTTVPGICTNPSVPLITATESVCQSGCAVGGGLFNTIIDCGTGSTLTYFTDLSGSITTSAPVYNQTTPMTIYYACVNNTTGCKSTVQTLTTNPGHCVNPLPVVISVTEPSCTVSTATLTVTSTLSGLSFSKDGIDYTNTTGVFNNIAASSFYSITAKNVNGCVSLATTGNINSQPSTPLMPNVTVTQPSCLLADATATVTSTITGLHFSIDGVNYTNTTGVFAGLTATTSYNITSRNSSLCVSPPASFTIDNQPATPNFPTTTSATLISANSFTANWNTVAAVSGYKIDVSTSASFTSFVPGYNNLTVSSGNSQLITGLSGNTTYHYRVRSYNASCTSLNSNSITAITHGIPTVSTAAITGITITTALGGGNVTANGGVAVSARGVCWNTSGAPTILDNLTTDGSGNGSFVSSILGLSAGNTYYIKAYATNTIGTAYGMQLTFFTPSGSDIIVTNTNDSGPGSLREALANITNNGVIRFASSLDGLTITLTSTLVVDKNVIFDNSTHLLGLCISGPGDNITITTGKSLTLTTGSKFTVTGNINNTAKGIGGLVIASGASLIQNTVNLPATVQRSLSNAWHLFGSPFKKNMGAVLSSITPLGGSVQMKPYTNGINWEANQTSAFYQLAPGVGYAVKPNITFTASLSGNLYYSPNVIDNTVSLMYNGTGANQSWNLMANPFTSFLNWNLLGLTNVSNTLYLWDNTLYPNVTPLTNTSYLRTFNSCNNVGVPAGTTPYIAPLQGFFVKAIYTSPKLVFSNSARTHTTSNYYKNFSNTEILVRLKAETDEGTDELAICKNSDAKSDFDKFDSEKLFNALPLEIYSLSNTGEPLIINTVNETSNTVIPVIMKGNAGKKAKITAFALESKEQLYLEDRLKAKVISLSENTSYEFEFPTDLISGRFFIRFGNVNAPLISSDVKVFEYNNELNIIAQTGEELQTIEVYSVTGAIVYKSEKGNKNVFTAKLDLNTGVYLVRVKTSVGTQNIKLNWK